MAMKVKMNVKQCEAHNVTPISENMFTFDGVSEDSTPKSRTTPLNSTPVSGVGIN